MYKSNLNEITVIQANSFENMIGREFEWIKEKMSLTEIHKAENILIQNRDCYFVIKSRYIRASNKWGTDENTINRIVTLRQNSFSDFENYYDEKNFNCSI